MKAPGIYRDSAKPLTADCLYYPLRGKINYKQVILLEFTKIPCAKYKNNDHVVSMMSMYTIALARMYQ